MSYLRTNYRRTGGQVDITAIGGGYPLASAQNGVGTPLAYGGFVYVRSYALGISEANLTANIMGDSTLGVMSFYYGSGQFGAGYKFLPLGFLVRSTASAMASDISGAWLSIPMVWKPTWSSSVWMFNCFGKTAPGSALSLAGGLGSALLTLGGLSYLLDVWGFIVSSP